jgi:fatty-acyl-CoA synthase
MFTFDWLAKRAELSPNKLALIDAATGRRFTYAQFHERASRLGEFLLGEWAIRPGDRVAILAPNSTDYFEVLYACAKIGAILVCLNWRLAVPELEAIVRDSTPRALVYDSQFAATAHALLGRTSIEQLIGLGGSALDGEWAYEQALSQASGRPIVMPPRGLDQVWHILYTAGTTGRPKGVLQTFGMVLYNALNIGLGIDLTSQDVTLNLLPCFHTGGLNMYANPTFHVGGTAIVQKAFEPAQTLHLLSTQATAFFGVAAVYLFMSQHPDFAKTDLSRVRSWASGGSALPTSLLELYAERGIIIQQGFGMTETGPTVFLIDREHALSKGGSVGKAQMHVQVRIVDGHGSDLPVGQAGELLIKGPGVTPGYWQLPDVTASSIEQGWLHSGDVARVDEDGYYFIVDRIKDMFISGGENVYPAEVENVIFQMPQVADVTVIGVPDPRWQEVGKAVIVVKPGMVLTEDEVLAFCRGKLANYKIPKSVAFVEQLPRNPAGKVLKQQVRSWFVPQSQAAGKSKGEG